MVDISIKESSGGGSAQNESILVVNKNEIFYNLINSGLTGLLGFLASMQIGAGLRVSILVGIAAMITRFKIYWDKEEDEYCKSGAFCFI